MRFRAESGFSLVEVVLALGLATFVMVALLGLGSLVLDQAGESKKEILRITMTQEAATALRDTPWDQLASFRPLYFDSEGRRVTNAAEAFYACRAEAPSSPGSPASLANQLVEYSLVLIWPAGAVSPNKVRMPVQVFRHD